MDYDWQALRLSQGMGDSMRGMRSIFLCGSGILLAVSPTTAIHASETKTYTYDARGRLVVVKSAGSVNANNTYSYCYDKAGNRIRYVATQTGTPATCVKTG